MKGTWVYRGNSTLMDLPKELVPGCTILLAPGEDLWFIPDPDVVRLNQMPPVLHITKLRRWYQFWRKGLR